MAFKLNEATFSFTESVKVDGCKTKQTNTVKVRYFKEDGVDLIEVTDGNKVTVVRNPVEKFGGTTYKPRMTDSQAVLQRIRSGSAKSMNPFTGEEMELRKPLKVVRKK